LKSAQKYNYQNKYRHEYGIVGYINIQLLYHTEYSDEKGRQQ